MKIELPIRDKAYLTAHGISGRYFRLKCPRTCGHVILLQSLMVQGVKRLLEACHITEMLQGGAELDALDKLVDKGRAVRDLVKSPGQVNYSSKPHPP